jgi:hypothetical protein
MACQGTYFPGTVRTAQRRIKRAGLKNYAAAKKSRILHNVNKRNRLQFVNQFLNHEFMTRNFGILSMRRRLQLVTEANAATTYTMLLIYIPSDHLKNKSSLLWSLCYSMGCHR